MNGDFIHPPALAERSALTGFAINRLNRMTERRSDAAFIDGLKQASASRTLVLSRDVPVLKRSGDCFDALFTTAEAAALGQERETAFLGLDGDTALFATLIDEAAPETSQGRDDVAMIDLRSVATQGLVSAEVLGALGQAKSLMHWHSRHRFCSNCGAPSRIAAAGWRRTCDVCNTHHFPRTDPVVIMLILDDESCLLGRQADYPAGMYSCLAGFVEAGETIEDAVRRETREESGVRVGEVEYFASQPWPFPSSLMIGAIAHAQTRRLTVDAKELQDARWFPREEVSLMLDNNHPDGFSCPPKLAVANLLIRAWAAGEAF
ncbi:NAD(+) diphosphatase [Methylocapsa palsarum]|uniref:NAD(+) diphosphatase n=1 Tax=Methylocapsa palsarum TaxID=1612308 RepID=A0A1I3VZP8_9HYPH|nr:NAD(+) diphosphatase [Methylocapsa palsarum]SFK00705.1 NAD+ diphosphatase [Methylocapsa palsarum]